MAKWLSLTFFALFVSCAHADPARFDLMGPKMDVRVTRGGKALPIASVPNLQGGDRIWLHPDLPASQSVRYLMVMAFLRGTTNPPPDDWFTRVETWNKKVREEGIEVTVPAEAEQALVFLAPVTGGDFGTLRSAVRGRPGVFVRASQDLNEAGFEQGRIEKYLASIRMVAAGDGKALLEHSNLLSRTLALRPNPDCFKRDPEQQVTCLTQTGSQTLLDDGHGQTVVAALTTGPSSDLISAASYTRMAGGGAYSAYVGAIVDLARLLGGLHTAQYQYIPAIAFPQSERLNLRLNTPPSFHNPKSVIVIGLPAIQKSVTPPLRSPDTQHVTCLLEPNAAIPLEGAPLAFSTAFAHGLFLRLEGDPAGLQDISLSADAYQGGLVVDKMPPRRALAEGSGEGAALADAPAKSERAAVPGVVRKGRIRGFWGFDPFEGPLVAVQAAPGGGWRVVSGEPLIAGRDDHLVLTSTGSACLESITFDSAGGASLKVAAKPSGGTGAGKDVEVDLPLASAMPGSLQLAIHQYGASTPVPLAIRTYSDPARIDAVVLHAGDRMATLTGQHLDQVREAVLNEVHFSANGARTSESVTLVAPAGIAAPAFRAGERVTAHVHLADGRVLDLAVTVSPPRPAFAVRAVSAANEANPSIKLIGNGDLRVDEPVTVILRSEAGIPRNEEVEIATADGTPAEALSVRLTFSSGALILQDARTLRVTFDPQKVFGASLFGPVNLRVVEPNAGPGNWMPVGTFVRLPNVTGLSCPTDTTKPCLLTGSGLFLIDSVASDASFTTSTVVPEEFSDTTLSVPRPAGGALYLHLRDDRGAVASLTIPIQVEPIRPVAGARTPTLRE